MGHHDGHHHQGHDYIEEQQYGAHPGHNFGSYEASSSYAPPPVPSYGYQAQQPFEYGDYGSVPSVPMDYGCAILPYAQESQMEHYRADEQSHRTNEHKGNTGSVPSVPYGAVQPYGGYGYLQPSYGCVSQPYAQENQMEHYRADEQSHRTNEHKGNTGAFGAEAFAAHEHWMEEKLAEVTAVSAAGYALSEHQQARHELEKNWSDSCVKKERLAEINMTEVVNRRKERRNVKLSTDPNSVAARKRRNKKSDRDQILRILVPDCKDESKVPIPLLYDRTKSFVLRLQALLQTQFNV